MKKFLCILLAFSCLLLAACSAAPVETTQSTDGKPVAAPDFTVYTADGQAVKLSDYLGTPVVLNFWASWCPPCKAEMPDFQEEFLARGESIQFLMVNLTVGNETLETATGFIAQQGYRFPVLYDTEADAANTYGIQSIPTTFFIDGAGNLIAQATGAIDRATLQKGIDMID